MDATYCYNMKNGSVWEFFLFRIPHIEDREEHRKNKVAAGEQKKEVCQKSSSATSAYFVFALAVGLTTGIIIAKQPVNVKRFLQKNRTFLYFCEQTQKMTLNRQSDAAQYLLLRHKLL